MKLFRVPAILALTAAALASPLQTERAGAQQMPQQAPAVPDSIQAMLQEFQALRQRVASVQDSTLEANPELVEARQDVQDFVRGKMIEEKPALEEDMERLDDLQAAVAEAQQTQDTTRLREIVEEGQRIQAEMNEAQQAALEREDVRTRMEAFQDRMMTAMTEVDQDIEEALARMETLAARLQAFQESMGGMGG